MSWTTWGVHWPPRRSPDHSAPSLSHLTTVQPSCPEQQAQTWESFLTPAPGPFSRSISQSVSWPCRPHGQNRSRNQPFLPGSSHLFRPPSWPMPPLLPPGPLHMLVPPLAPHASLHGSVQAASPAMPCQTCAVRPDPDSPISSLFYLPPAQHAFLSSLGQLWTVNPISTGTASIVAVSLELVAGAHQAIVGRMRKGIDEHPSLHAPS